jgi:hypothetical protein
LVFGQSAAAASIATRLSSGCLSPFLLLLLLPSTEKKMRKRKQTAMECMKEGRKEGRIYIVHTFSNDCYGLAYKELHGRLKNRLEKEASNVNLHQLTRLGLPDALNIYVKYFCNTVLLSQP